MRSARAKLVVSVTAAKRRQSESVRDSALSRIRVPRPMTDALSSGTRMISCGLDPGLSEEPPAAALDPITGRRSRSGETGESLG